MNIVIQGLGFVGSAMATVVSSILDKSGNPIFNVIGVDKNNSAGVHRIRSINKGTFPFDTNDEKLKKEIYNAHLRGNIKANSDPFSFSKADVVIVSINCDLDDYESVKPQIKIDHFIEGIEQIATNIKEKTLVIIESTVPPGMCSEIIYPTIVNVLDKRGLNPNDFYLAHSYERVMPGKNYYNSIINFWRVYAGVNRKSAEKCRDFLSKVVNVKDFPLTELENTTSSETAKVLENSYRAVNIAFIDEWSKFAEEVNIDLFKVIEAIKARPTHNNIMRPGFGVGGYCLTKDPLFAKISSKQILGLSSQEFPFSTKAVKINSKMPLHTLKRVIDFFDGDLKGVNILLMGISYREDVGDTRFSPSEIFYKEAKREGASINVHDPMVDFWHETDLKINKKIPNLNNYHCIVFAVPHTDYQKIDFNECKINKRVLIFDANNVLTNEQYRIAKKLKLNCISNGRG